MFKKRAKVLSLIIILINLVTFPASSEIVNKINVTGNDRISDQTIIMFSDINYKFHFFLIKLLLYF